MLLVGRRIFAVFQLAFRIFYFDEMGSQDFPLAAAANCGVGIGRGPLQLEAHVFVTLG
jgi:hypothetical protein